MGCGLVTWAGRGQLKIITILGPCMGHHSDISFSARKQKHVVHQEQEYPLFPDNTSNSTTPPPGRTSIGYPLLQLAPPFPHLPHRLLPSLLELCPA